MFIMYSLCADNKALLARDIFDKTKNQNHIKTHLINSKKASMIRSILVQISVN